MINKISTPDEPIQITEIKVDDRVVELGGSFDAAGDNWADAVSVTAQNISNKTITAANIILLFPTGPKTQVLFKLTYEGQAEPNTALRLTAAAPHYHKLMPFLAERGEVANFSRASLVIDQVFFSDDTLWAQGTIFRKNDGGRWTVISTPKARRVKSHHASSLGTRSVLPPVRPAAWCISLDPWEACTGRPPERHCQAVTVNTAINYDGVYDSYPASQDLPGR